MKTVTTTEKQTLFDIAVQYYGTPEAVGELLALNPHLTNNGEGYGTDAAQFYFDLPLRAGITLNVNDQSPHHNKNLIKEITEPVSTFQEWDEA